MLEHLLMAVNLIHQSREWTEALLLMPVGSKFKLYLPQSIAYGARGAGDVIQPYSTLIFEVELLEIMD
jgi:FKBP-type peptidyl-prolyl cis-trans isomerase FklB